MADEEQPEALALPIDWRIPESVITRYANNIVVQQGQSEFIISFFEVKPPFLMGEVTTEQMKNLRSVPAECVARIVITAQQMPGFIKALQTNLERFTAKQGGND